MKTRITTRYRHAQTPTILEMIALGAIALLLMFMPGGVQAQGNGTVTPETVIATTESVTDTSPDTLDADELVEIDWVDKIRQGGFTMVALVLLSVTGLAIALERMMAIRLVHVAPAGFAEESLTLMRKGDFAAVHARCEEQPSTLGRVVDFIVKHRNNPIDTITTSAGDIAGRDIRNMLARTAPLAVIASLAPLLGLLGTMIGMIEAFEMVAMYGDEGGASMLAGSIAKALITTAVGLIIAIPALAAYQFFKQRINNLTQQLEIDTEEILSAMFLKKAKSAASGKKQEDGSKDRPTVVTATT